MKPRILSRTLQLASLAALGLAGLACATGDNIYTTYEERYRVFLLKNQVTPQRLVEDPDGSAKNFPAMASLNRSFEELAGEGFKLVKIEPLLDGGGATQFVFRRAIPEGYRPTLAPLDFAGLYRWQNEDKSKTVYYILDPRPDGYRVHLVTPPGEEIVNARWDGAKLNWRVGDEENSAVLSPDGRSLLHTESTLLPNTPLSTRTTEALRVLESKPSAK